jgi:catechol 2,3-dioxygenase-like lactoylglutathione lyase family enzyme
MARLFRVIVPVRDIEAGARFYEAVLATKGARISPGRHYLDCEGTILAVFDPQADGDGYDAKPLPEPIYFAVDDLGATFPSATIPEVGPLGEIARRPWGETSFYASDPFGNPLCFVDRPSMFTGQPE